MCRSMQPREVLVAVPGDSADIYLRHQQVWQALHLCGAMTGMRIECGADFVFCREAEQLYRVRSERLAARLGRPVRLARAGRFAIDVVAARGSSQGEPVPAERVPAWFAELARGHGLAVEVERCALRWERGIKHDRRQARALRIAHPVAAIAGRYEVANELLAAQAYAAGIGRGKRFGFGMFRAVDAPGPGVRM